MADEGYSVKDVVDITRREQTAGFARLETLLSTKADKADVESLRTDLNSHRHETNRRLGTLEDARVATEAVDRVRTKSRSDRWTFWGLVAASGAAAGAIGGAIIFVVH